MYLCIFSNLRLPPHKKVLDFFLDMPLLFLVTAILSNSFVKYYFPSENTGAPKQPVVNLNSVDLQDLIGRIRHHVLVNRLRVSKDSGGRAKFHPP